MRGNKRTTLQGWERPRKPGNLSVRKADIPVELTTRDLQNMKQELLFVCYV
jgi:hypothetical protein